MRWRAVIALIAACELASCATHVDQVSVSGYFWVVSPDDIRAAVRADRGCTPFASEKIVTVDVENRNEVHIYHYPGASLYDRILRIRGQWKCVGYTTIE
jgi:hypothetical protein